MTRRSTTKAKEQDAASPAPSIPKIPPAQVLPRLAALKAAKKLLYAERKALRAAAFADTSLAEIEAQHKAQHARRVRHGVSQREG